MSVPPDARRSSLTASKVLQGKVESSLQRSVFHKWQTFVKDRQFDVHLKRCATTMKYSTRRRMYSTYFTRWLVAAQRSASAEAKKLYVIPKEVPITSKKAIIAFTRRYFGKWKRHNRERKQRTVANVETVLNMNDERARYRALFAWQGRVLDKYKARPQFTPELKVSCTHLVESALRAVDVLGGQSGAAETLQPILEETPEQETDRFDKTANALSGLCEDLVVVLVLANEWSQDGQSERVSELLERLWRENSQLKEANEEKDATTAELRSVMDEVLSNLDSTRRTRDDPSTSEKRKQDAEIAAKYAAANGDTMPTELLKAAKAATAAISATEKGLVLKADEVGGLQDTIEGAIGVLGTDDALQSLRAAGADGPDRNALLSKILDKLVADVAQAAAEAPADKDVSLAQRLRNDQKQLSDAKKHTDDLSKQLDDAQKALAALRDELDGDRGASERQKDEARQLIAGLQAREAELGGKVEQLNTNLEQLEVQLQEQKSATQQAEDALKAARGEVQGLSDTVTRQEAAINDLERSNQNAAKRLEQLADQFEAKSNEYREKEAQQAVEVQELQNAVERALVAIQGEEESHSLLDTAMMSKSDAPTTKDKRSRALVDALDVACHYVEGLQDGESISEFINRTAKDQAALEAKLRDGQEGFDKLDHIVAVANELLLCPRLSDISIEAAGAVVAAEALASDGAPGAKTLMTTVQGVADEACSCLETVPKPADRNPPQESLNESESESVKAILKQCGDALYDVSGQLTTSRQETASNEALSVFLRDVVRDAIGRVATLANNLCATLGGETSPSAWQSLQLTANPMALSMDRDPSEYVEYILQNVDLNDEGKRVVQDHLRTEARLEPKLNKVQLAPPAAPATRESLGSTLDPLTSQERRSEEAPATATAPVTSRPPCTWDVVAEFHDLLAMITDLSLQYDEKFNQQAKLITVMDNALKHIVSDLQLHTDATPEDVSRAVQDAARACNTWGTFADDCMEALGGHTDERRKSTGRLSSNPEIAEEVGAKLLEQCSAAMEAVKRIRRDLGLPPMPATGNASWIQDDLKAVHGHLNQLQSIRDESDAFIQGLNRAFDDETLSSTGSSTLSSRGRSLRAKKKPLAAAAIKEGEVFFLKKGEKPSANALRDMTPDEKLRALRASARDKLEEVQELRRACRSTLFILEGSYAPSKKAPVYGEALVPRLLQQLENLKRALPLTDPYVVEDASVSGSTTTDETDVTISTRLTTLANMVNSLRLSQAGLEESLAAKALQGAVALEDAQRENAQWKEQCKRLKGTVQAAQQDQQNTSVTLGEVQDALSAERAISAQAQAEADAACRALQEAQDAKTVTEVQLEAERNDNEELTRHAAILQHQTNVLTDALGDALTAMVTSSLAAGGDSGAAAVESPKQDLGAELTNANAMSVPTSQVEMEKTLQHLLATGDGVGVGALVQAAIAQHKQQMRDSCDGYRCQFAALRAELEELKSYVVQSFTCELQPLCSDVLREMEDAMQLLTVENEMLRPRAQERESLVREKDALLLAVEETRAELLATKAELDRSDGANARLRRSLREAEMTRILCGDENGDGPSSSGRGVADTSPERGLNQKQYMRSGEYANLLTDLEGKMIRGATAMTLEAMDAMSGKDMTKEFGAVAEDTCNLYACVERRLLAVVDAFSMYPPTNTFNQKCLQESVESEMRALKKDADRAQRLKSRLPPFFAAPYTQIAAS